MKLFFRLSCCLALLLSASRVPAQQSKEVLFLGNSYTYVNDLPALTADIATSLGDTLIYDQNTPGGYTLQGHSTNATSLSKINSRPWDFVILQDQSQRPSLSPAYVGSNVYPFAATLDQLIEANDSCTQTLFYMTWGRKNGDASNCTNWPPVCTYEGMQGMLYERYRYMASQHGEVAPVGMAWRVVRDSAANLELYNPDQSHPSLNGSYLAACVFYASIFRKSPIGATWPTNVDSADAVLMQQVADQVVLDSLDRWYIDTNSVRADFSWSLSGGTGLSAQFSNLSLHADAYWWDFGDGNTSSQPAPLHTYAASGTYPVTLLAVRGCQTDTLTDSVTVLLVGRNDPSSEPKILVYPTEFSNQLNLRGIPTGEKVQIQVIDLTGKTVFEKEVLVEEDLRIELGFLAQGNYFLRVFGENLYSVSRINRI